METIKLLKETNMFKDKVKEVLIDKLKVINEVGDEIGKLTKDGNKILKELTPSVINKRTQEVMNTRDLVLLLTYVLSTIQASQGEIDKAITYLEGVETI